MLLVFDKSKKTSLSFSEKVKCLKENKIFDNYPMIRHVLGALFSINNVRNNLAHKLAFNITISEVDTIGYNFGRDYIIERYKYDNKDEESVRKLLLWVLNLLIWDSCYIIVDQIIKYKAANLNSALEKKEGVKE